MDIKILFNLFGLPVTGWALCVALGCLAAAALVWFLGTKRKMEGDTLSLYVPLTLALSVFLGHGLFALLAGLLDSFVPESMNLTLPGYVFRPDKGGYMSLGALSGLLLSSLIVSRVKKASSRELLRIGLPAVLLAIGVAKWGEWLCGMGFGPEAVTCFFPLSFQPEPAEYPAWHQIAVFWLGGVYALCLAGWGCVGALHKDGVRPVDLIVFYLGGQIMWDMLREDSYVHYLTMSFVRMDQLFSVLILAGLMIWSTIRIRPSISAGTVRGTILLLAGVSLLVGGLVLNERELPVIGEPPVWLLYCMMAVGAALTVLAALRIHHIKGAGVFRWWTLMLVSVGLCIYLQFLFDKPLPLPGGALIYFPNWFIYPMIGVTAAGMCLSTRKLLVMAGKR